MFDNYFMIIPKTKMVTATKMSESPFKADRAVRVTLTEAKEQIAGLQEGYLVYISPGLVSLIANSEISDDDASVFEAFL